ncbi:MAG TPA: HutD family protein [Ilumatobacteraceae bacterium]
MRVQRSSEHRIVPWANGLGITADVVLSPPPPLEWTWRVSIADVSDDVPFSVMPGIDRHIVVAQGAGMALSIAGAAAVRMDGATPPLSFSGDDVTTCRLLDGPIHDLNLMVRRGRAVGSLAVHQLTAGSTFVLAADAVVAIVLDGAVRWESADLAGFDALVIEDPVGPVVLDAIADSTVAVATVTVTDIVSG